MLNKVMTALAIASLMVSSVLAAEAQQKPVVESHMGPVIKNFGAVVDVPDGSYVLKKGTHYKASMDVSDSADDNSILNRHFESAARYLNMNARSGIDAADMEFALIVHGKAVKDILTDEAYQAEFNQPNPNTDLLAALKSAGVTIYVCGQSIGLRGFSVEQISPAVSIAISAMSAHVRLQSEGFTVIPF